MYTSGGHALRYHLTEKEIAAIEKVLNMGGKKEVIIRVEGGQVAVVQAERKRIA